jgi:hypothetical protein
MKLFCTVCNIKAFDYAQLVYGQFCKIHQVNKLYVLAYYSLIKVA